VITQSDWRKGRSVFSSAGHKDVDRFFCSETHRRIERQRFEIVRACFVDAHKKKKKKRQQRDREGERDHRPVE